MKVGIYIDKIGCDEREMKRASETLVKIETLWNVKMDSNKLQSIYNDVKIETLWNVKIFPSIKISTT